MFNPNGITMEEIHAAYRILISCGLPAEIAIIILDFAEYWHGHYYIKEVPLELRYVSTDFMEVSSLYLQTSPLGCLGGLDKLPMVRPRKVVFRLVGRDTNPRSGRGLYENHQAWFDASIFREDEAWVGGGRQEPIYALHLKAISAAPAAGIDHGHRDREKLEHGDEWAIFYWGKDPHTLPQWFCEDGTRLVGGFKVVHNGEKQTWLLQRNRYTTIDFDEYTIEWRREDVGEPRTEEWPLNGSGSGTNFVASLQRGDRIGVWARSNVSDPTLKYVPTTYSRGSVREESDQVCRN
jgi:hypothetical protein